jgi:hypothetical protein
MESAQERTAFQGLKFFKPLAGLLEGLREQNPDPKRQLFYDDYLVLLLLYYFNPTLTSLRSIQRASDFGALRKRLGIRRASLGSLSESARVFDPELLRGMFLHLAEDAAGLASPAVPRPRGVPSDLKILAADGTLWSFLPRMAPWFWGAGPRTGPPPGFKALVHFDVMRGVPVEADVASGYPSERRLLEKNLRPGAFYVLDRGFFDFTLFQAIIGRSSSFLCRAKETTVTRTLETRPLDAAAIAAGVLSDECVEAGSDPHKNKLHQPLRRICGRVQLEPPHNLNAKRQAQNEFVELTLLTDRFDIPAGDLLLLYRYRWHIELFFRWIKCTLGCKHFLSHSQNGFELQFYAGLIAGLLIVLWTGKKPNKATLEAVQFHLLGLVTSAELNEHLRRCKKARA